MGRPSFETETFSSFDTVSIPALFLAVLMGDGVACWTAM